MEKSTLSPIVAGTMNWGVWDKNLSATEMAHLIHLCVEQGISSFDHADIYGLYTTEATFGEGFAQSGVPREKIQLISKCGIALPNRPFGDAAALQNPNRIKHYNYDRDYIIASAEQSLRNLKTDYLDVLLLHRPSPLMQTDEIVEAVTTLKTSGKIREFGLSNFTTSQTELIRQRTEVAYNQIQFSATHFDPMLDGSLDYMQLHQIRPMSWNPLGTVFREDIEQTRRLKKLLADLVAKYHLGADTILLSWVLQHPAGIIPVAGTVNVARIQSLMKAVELKLEREDWFAIWAASRGNEVP